MSSDSITTPGVMAFRFDAPLIFANASYFRAKVKQTEKKKKQAKNQKRERAEERKSFHALASFRFDSPPIFTNFYLRAKVKQ
jgi:MFS superfamily sulfate permease-like transporter